mmetsp:Transcript_16752/g.52170  ORF Transcript_16752/g.52170 Transcript_16752/m.52170 type:complete len:207 (-) Transcript_16752:779-1399(-)
MAQRRRRPRVPGGLRGQARPRRCDAAQHGSEGAAPRRRRVAGDVRPDEWRRRGQRAVRRGRDLHGPALQAQDAYGVRRVRGRRASLVRSHGSLADGQEHRRRRRLQERHGHRRRGVAAHAARGHVGSTARRLARPVSHPRRELQAFALSAGTGDPHPIAVAPERPRPRGPLAHRADRLAAFQDVGNDHHAPVRSGATRPDSYDKRR